MAPKRSDVPLKVFVSSTSEDLKDYRAVARLAICDMEWAPRMMEHFGALDAPTVDACYAKLDESDLVVLLLAFRRGWVPSVAQGGNGRDSMTALELARAREKKIPVLAFLATENWPGGLWEKDDEARRWVEQFRAGLNLPAEFFEPEPQRAGSEGLPVFRANVLKALTGFHERWLAEQSTGGEEPAADYYEGARSAIASGRCIPFIGLGVYGTGPLSAPAILAAYPRPACEEASLVAGSECHEEFVGNRDAFLDAYEKILESQAAIAPPPAVHDLLLRVKRPPLIVSATGDLALERRLAARGVVVVCHVVHSWHREHDGKILVFRGLEDSKPELALADKVDLGAERDRYVVYKPFGAPGLHRLLDADRQIDTVVATEADHLAFLSRLGMECTGVPTAFTRPLQQNPLLFLGYPLDVWNYRLVLQVFRAIGGSGHPNFTVREFSSEMERMAWERLMARVVRTDPNTFAARVSAAL